MAIQLDAYYLERYEIHRLSHGTHLRSLYQRDICGCPARAREPRGTAAARAAASEAGKVVRDQEAAKQQWIDAMNTAFRAGIEEAPRVRLRSFLEEIEKFVVQIEELYYASVVEEWSQDELDQRSKDIAETTDRLRDFVNFQTEPPQINVAPLPEENLSLRIIRLVNLSHRLIPNIISLAVGGTVGLDQLNQVRDDLAITEALSRSLPESEF